MREVSPRNNANLAAQESSRSTVATTLSSAMHPPDPTLAKLHYASEHWWCPQEDVSNPQIQLVT